MGIMAAIEWEIYVPYQEDITQALAEARQLAFKLGDYRKPYAFVEWLDQRHRNVSKQGNFFTTDDEGREVIIKHLGIDILRVPLARMGVEEFDIWYHDINRADRVHTIEELMCLAALSIGGTASILDIASLSDTPKYGCAAPFTSEEMLLYFGTLTPKRKDVQASSAMYRSIGCGQARYIIIYDTYIISDEEEEVPREILFWGYSYG
jgi:hypothetical protein